MTWLVITGDDGLERVVELGAGTLRIGRGARNDIVLPDANKGVSRAHAELRFEEGRYVIVDLQSQNGTWVNGQRVQRAELPPGGEITVGMYHLRRTDGERPTSTPVSTAAIGSKSSPPTDTWPEVVISRAATGVDHEEEPAQATGKKSSGPLVAGLAIAAVALVGIAVWQLGTGPAVNSEGTNSGSAPVVEGTPPAVPPSVPAVTAPAPPSEIPPPTVVADPPVVPEKPPEAAAVTPVPAPRRAAPPSRTAALPPVPRKPNESVDAWRNRIAALDARYEYSKAALERGDFGSAASGFEAILREEPGFLDAPGLLIQARAGLRAAALDVLAAGNRLDAAGDWFGALQQYERAREVDAGTPGVDAAVKRVRDKLRAAGEDALERGREEERLGRPAAALQEYEKALQWLPSDDPNRELARARADLLRAR